MLYSRGVFRFGENECSSGVGTMADFPIYNITDRIMNFNHGRTLDLDRMKKTTGKPTPGRHVGIRLHETRSRGPLHGNQHPARFRRD